MKKIALFPGEVSSEFQFKICEAVSSVCREQGIHLTVFHNFSVYGSNVFHAYGERSVIHIPNLKNYDGFVVLSNALGLDGMREELFSLLKKEVPERPVVCLREEVGEFYNVLIDDYSAMRHMVEHFIKHHGLTRICFMKGREDFKDAAIRFQAYQDVMQENGLEITEHMTFDGDYWKFRGDAAVKWFWDTVEEKPQAIVCANDYMAISVQEALQKRGVRIPDEVRVSGFDDSEEARYISPPISTMRVDHRKMLQKAVDMMQNVWEGKPQQRVEMVTADDCFRESCGCRQELDVRQQSELFRSKETLINVIQQATMLQVDCDNVNTLEDLMWLAAYYLRAGDGHERVYLCLCDEEEKQSERVEMAGKYTEYMELHSCMNAYNSFLCEERFRRDTILPERFIKAEEPLYVSPLHDKSDCIGYFVVTPGFSEGLNAFFQLWVQAVTSSILRQRADLEGRQLAERLNTDELTGIPNRRKLGFVLQSADTALKFEGKTYYIASVDMDGLKYINDNFGHVIGDEALCAMADILTQTVEEPDIVARTGGDEFIVCYRTDDSEAVQKRIRGIRDALERYNRESGKEYELSASIGYAKCENGMIPTKCIQLADAMMYQEKRGKKNSRQPG